MSAPQQRPPDMAAHNQHDPLDSHWEVMRQLLLGINCVSWRRLPDATDLCAVEPSVVYRLDTGIYAHAIQYPELAKSPAALHIWRDLREHSEAHPIPNVYRTTPARPLTHQPLGEDGQPLAVLHTLFMYLTQRDFFLKRPLLTRMDAFTAGQWPPTADDLRQCAWIAIVLDNLRQLQPSPVEWQLSMRELDPALVQLALHGWALSDEAGVGPGLPHPQVVSGRLVTPLPTPTLASAPTPSTARWAAPLVSTPKPPSALPPPNEDDPANRVIAQLLFERQQARWQAAREAVAQAGQALITAVAAVDPTFLRAVHYERTESEKVAKVTDWLGEQLGTQDEPTRQKLLRLYAARARAEGADTEAMVLTQVLCGRRPLGHVLDTSTGRARCADCLAELVVDPYGLALATATAAAAHSGRVTEAADSADWLTR